MTDLQSSLLVALFLAIDVIVILAAIGAVRRGLKHPLRLKNPANGYVEEARLPFLWSLLFGVFYYAAKGLWLAAILAVLFPPLWLVFPFCTRGMLRRHYLRQGWEELA